MIQLHIGCDITIEKSILITILLTSIVALVLYLFIMKYTWNKKNFDKNKIFMNISIITEDDNINTFSYKIKVKDTSK